MSQETIAALAERLEADAELRAELASATDAEQAARILVGEGFPVTAADIALAPAGELGDADLGAVSGGLINPDAVGQTFAYAWTVCV